MSIEVLDWAFKFKHPDMTSTMKLVLLVLADFTGDEDESFPRQTTIADRTELTRESVNKNLKKLEDLGVIKKTRQTRDDGSSRSSLYKVMIPESARRHRDPKDTGKNVNKDHTTAVNKDHPGVNEDHAKRDRGSHPNVNEDHTFNLPLEPSIQPPIKNRKKTAAWPADYRDQFWKLYPKKSGDSRKKAFEKLNQIEDSDEVEFKDLMTGLGYYATRMNDDVKEDPKNERFIAAANVWLNQARWETERPVEKKASFSTWKGMNSKKVTAI